MKFPDIIYKYKVMIASALIIFLCSHSSWTQEGNVNDPKPEDNSIEQMIANINTDVDPDFLYEYEQTKFVPPPGKTLVIMGQTVESITEYLEFFPQQKLPGGWTAYWGVTEYAGIEEPHKNITGNTQNHQMLVEKFPNTVIQSAMWMVGTWDVAKKAAKGDYDKVIKKFSRWAQTTGRPIYLRIGYEFDGPHNALEPEEYIRAYKHIVDLIRKEGGSNIAFVWHSYASKPYKGHPLSAWYPGDEYVDWVAISVFGHAYEGSDFGLYCNDVLEFAKQHKKPVMIAESNPVNGIDKIDSSVWEDWFVNYFSFIYNKNIKAFSFINEDWTRIKMEGISEWKDARLYNNQLISNAWFAETGKDRYLKQSPDLFDYLGYSIE